MGERATSGELVSGADVGGVGIGLFTNAVDPIGRRTPLLKTIGPGEALLWRESTCSSSLCGVERRLFRLCWGPFHTPVPPIVMSNGAEVGNSRCTLRMLGRLA